MGGKGDDKSSTATTDASTKVTNTTTNQQVGASEGSTAFGANSTVNITSSDSSVVMGALASNNTAIKDALYFAGEEGSRAAGLVSKVLDKNPTPANETSTILTGIASMVEKNLTTAASTVDTTGNKNLIIAVSVIGAAAFVIYLFKSK